MCDLAATGADGALLGTLLVAALIAIGAGVLLLRRAGAVAAVALAAVLVIGVVAAPAPAQAACPPGTPSAAPSVPPVAVASIGLIVTDTFFGLSGPRTVGVDVENLSTTVTARNVTLQGTPPAGLSVDASGCAAIAPASTCTIVVDISAGASPFAWSYLVAGDNTNSVVDSITALALTTLSISPTVAAFTVPGDAVPFTVVNTGTDDAWMPVATLAGADPGAYTIGANSCSGVLPAGASCSLQVTLGLPIASGSAELRVTAVNSATVVAALSL